MKNPIAISLLLLMFSCWTPDTEIMDVQTNIVTSITHSTAIVYCQTIDGSGYSPSRSGVLLWQEGTEIPDTVYTFGMPGNYRVALTELQPNREYHVKAFIKNHTHQKEGNTLTFNTRDAATFIDPRDGQTYLYLQFGHQNWMVENMRYHIDENSFAIEDEYYGDLSEFGLVYSPEVSQSVCPAGWHLPTDEEWRTLEVFLGMPSETADSMGTRGAIAFDMMYPGEQFPYTSKQCTNNSGFTAIPIGWKNQNKLVGVGSYSNYLSATQDENGWIVRQFAQNQNWIGRLSGNVTTASIRCVKDE